MRRKHRHCSTAWILAIFTTATHMVGAQIGTGPQPEVGASGRLLVHPKQLTQRERLEYNPRDNYCWLLAHTSVRVGNEIIINDGMAKYVWETRLNGSSASSVVEVLDLNAWTMSLSLTSDFAVGKPPLTLWQPRNARSHPPTNRGGLWRNQTHVFSVGGHYYSALRYNESDYYVPHDSIPGFEIWAGDVKRRQWEKFEFKGVGGERLDRTVSGAAECTPDDDGDEKCYYLGGYKSTRTSSQHPINWSLSQRGMLEFNPTSGTIRNDSKAMDGYGDPTMGYQFGTMHHLPIGCGSGVMLSLMAEQSAIDNVTTTDDDLRGQPVNTTSVMIYDIDTKTWHRQRTANFEGERPAPRTRYCGDVMYSESTKSWDLWLYGGQMVEDPDNGVEDVHVLTMPKFQWVRVDLKANPDIPHPRAIRGHTCHAVNSQLLVFGGTGRGIEVNQGDSCQPANSPSLVSIIDTNTGSWRSNFSASAHAYASLPIISSAGGVGNRDPQAGWSNDRLKELFDKGMCGKWMSGMSEAKKGKGSDGEKLSGGQIAGIVVGVVAGVVLLLVAAWFVMKSVKKRGTKTTETGTETGTIRSF